MRLFLDIGNTRLKWALDGGFVDGSIESGHVDYKKTGWESRHYVGAPKAIESVWASCVASNAVQESIERWVKNEFNQTVNWFDVSQFRCGVRNGYEVLSQLGVDRWAAVLGAKKYLLDSGQADCAAIIVDAGTAVTVDVLSPDSVFTGGVIFPGLNLMHDSLTGQTAGITSALGGDVSVFGKNTLKCVNAGVHYALYGSVERIVFEIKEGLDLAQSKVLLLLTGGDAQLIAQNTQLQAKVLPSLVIDGLKYVVNSGEFK